MKSFNWLCLPLLAFGLSILIGCSRGTKDQSKEVDKGSDSDKTPGKQHGAATVQTNLEKLKPDDRMLADEQQFCAVETKNPLGSMGVPVKVMVKSQPVFLCCDACETKAKAHADRTLAKVQELKEKRAKTPPK